jgi:hypothetical protein
MLYRFYAWDYKSLIRIWNQGQRNQDEASEKGQLEELEAFYDALKDPRGRWPIELEDMIQTTEVTFAVESSV